MCSLESRDCRSEKCPSRSFLEALFENADLDPDDTMSYKQWGHESHLKLLDLTVHVSEFIHELCEKCDSCTSHHFTAKAQATYLKELKGKIPINEQAIILMDFAENYSFQCQDSVQGFHWDTSQVTLHHVVVY